VEAVVLPALRESLSILSRKSPGDVRQYRDTVLAAVQRVAAAAHGVQEAEAAAIEKVQQALSRDTPDGDAPGRDAPDGDAPGRDAPSGDAPD
jgi:hypothetical protein